MKDKKKYYVVVTVAAAVIGFFAGYLNTKNEELMVQKLSYQDVSTMTANDEVAYWAHIIEQEDGFKAYEEFGKLYGDVSYTEQHTHAHSFGEALFKTMGVNGVAVCDSNFGFGCYHSFFGWALMTYGTGIIKNLDEECIAVYGEKGLGCQHGIGHGVLVELGLDKLEESLELCALLNWQGPIGGCTSGVFMENNFNTMGDAVVRAVNDADYQYPCSVVGERYKEACYFEQPAWWLAVEANDLELTGRLCAQAPSLREREACYRGVGNTVAGTREYNAEEMLQACVRMPDTESELLCIEGATWLLSAQPEFQGTWEVMCEALEGDAHKRCLDSVNFI